jgi:hypothetical protein
MKTTGQPPGLLQDDCRKLFRWFADRVDARWTLRRVLEEYSTDEKKPAHKAGHLSRNHW